MAKFILKEALKNSGYTQYRLAKELKVTVGEVYRWCQEGYNPTLKTMIRISRALDLNVSDLIEE